MILRSVFFFEGNISLQLVLMLFFLQSRFGGHSVNKIFGNENVLSALHTQKRGDHLMIFFDTASLDIHSKSVLDEIVYGDFLK